MNRETEIRVKLPVNSKFVGNDQYVKKGVEEFLPKKKLICQHLVFGFLGSGI